MAGSAGATFLSHHQVITPHLRRPFRPLRRSIHYRDRQPGLVPPTAIPFPISHYTGWTKWRHSYEPPSATPAFCTAWKSIVAAGLTDDHTPLGALSTSKLPIPVHGSSPDISAGPGRRSPGDQPLTFAAWSAPILSLVDDANREQLTFLGLFDDTPRPRHRPHFGRCPPTPAGDPTGHATRRQGYDRHAPRNNGRIAFRPLRRPQRRRIGILHFIPHDTFLFTCQCIFLFTRHGIFLCTRHGILLCTRHSIGRSPPLRRYKAASSFTVTTTCKRPWQKRWASPWALPPY